MADPLENDKVRRLLLLHLLQHRGQQVRFEASQWATEFGMLRTFPDVDPAAVRSALRSLEMARLVVQRTQYVVGYSEPKNVYSLTPAGHRQAIECREGGPTMGDPSGPDDPSESGPSSSVTARGVPTS